MKFISNTKPISDGLDIVIISSNITKFYQKSCIVELTIEENALRINTEVASIKSEIIFKGNSSDEGSNHIFVDSLLFKNLIKTLETDTIEFEIKNDSLSIYSGKSKFNLPQVVADNEMSLARPQRIDYSTDVSEIDQNGWNFIKNQQMYAIAMSFIHPVYTNVWLSNSGDAIVGDFDNSIFTHSNKVNLDSTCLITDTIVNLLTTLPEDSKIYKVDKNYELKVDTDPYNYLCEFVPKYEEDEGVGNYNSEIILSLFDHSLGEIDIDAEKLLKYISQAELFINDDILEMHVTSDEFSLTNEHIDCKLSIDNNCGEFDLKFKIPLLKDMLLHLNSDKIKVCPFKQGDTTVGIIAWTDEVEAVLAGCE